MSGAETNPGPQELNIYLKETTHYGLHDLPPELLIEVMKHLPDMAALSRLFTAYPKTLRYFRGSGNRNFVGNDIFASMVNKMSLELRNSALDVLAVRSRPPIRPSQITGFIRDCLKAEVHDAQARLANYSLSIILDLITVSESIESLTESFARDRVLGPCLQHSIPLSPIELHRIRRSLWRFQLCYDMCHPESSPECCDVKSRSTRQPFSDSMPNWLQCRGESYCPEALSRFLPNLACWEHDELEAIRFHLAHEVNRIQYRRPCEPVDKLCLQPVLLRRLIRDIDHWDTRSPDDHVLVAAFSQNQYTRNYPIVWDRVRDLYEASVPNTPRRFDMQALQGGHPQWGWCLWDEKRLVKRGMIDIEYDDWLKNQKKDDESQTAEMYGRRAVLDRVHRECVASQYTFLDRRIAAQYAIDAQIHADRIK